LTPLGEVGRPTLERNWMAEQRNKIKNKMVGLPKVMKNVHLLGGSNKRCKNVGRHFWGCSLMNLVHSLDFLIQRPLSSLNFRDDELLWICFVP